MVTHQLPEHRAITLLRERLVSHGVVLASHLNGRAMTLEKLTEQFRLAPADVAAVFPNDEAFRGELARRMTDRFQEFVNEELASLPTHPTFEAEVWAFCRAYHNFSIA